MNVRRCLDPAPRTGIAAGELGTQRLVGECNAVLDIAREVVRAGRRDDVDLHRHARSQLHARPRPDRRVDPLVEVDLVAGVEEDAEERVAQPAVDDLLQRAAGLADAQRPVPLDDRLEIRPGEPLDVVADADLQLAASSTTQPGATVERAPDSERGREGSPRSMRRSHGLSRPQRARGPAVSIRWHDSGVPFQPSRATASCSVMPGFRLNTRLRTP